jgi:hypothetical protein
MKSLKILSLVFVALLISTTVLAKSESVIYRHRADWVKLEELSSKQLAGNQLLHPCSSIVVDQMSAMLQSLQVNKKQIFSKGFKTSEIFTVEEAQKFAPYIIEALGKAAPNEVVNVGIVHKRPYFIMRNDFFSMINVFITDQGVHFNFSKLFAKLDAEYAQASQIDKAISRAKSTRVSLEPSPGQTLVADVDEVILDPTFNFGQGTIASITATATKTTQETQVTNPKTKQPVAASPTPSSTTTNTETAPTNDVATRLQKLEELKKSKLITSKEYEEKKKEILSEL